MKSIADEVAAADHQPARDLPGEIEASMNGGNDRVDASTRIGGVLDAFDDIQNRLLALAGGPSAQLTSG